MQTHLEFWIWNFWVGSAARLCRTKGSKTYEIDQKLSKIIKNHSEIFPEMAPNLVKERQKQGTVKGRWNFIFSRKPPDKISLCQILKYYHLSDPSNCGTKSRARTCFFDLSNVGCTFLECCQTKRNRISKIWSTSKFRNFLYSEILCYFPKKLLYFQ